MEIPAKEDIIAKLKYLNLDLENMPDFLTSFNALNFNISRLNNDRDHRIFKYVPIDEIEILFTPCLRSDNIKAKYSEAVPLFKYIYPGTEEEDIERYTTFLKMLANLSVSDVENISVLQKELEKAEPFKVTYTKDNLWQIYYSESTNKYFMLVCTKESTFSEFFYLLKRKIEFSKNNRLKNAPQIYVPINYLNYSEVFLNINEIADLENYLWLFTKNWALIFEVYNKNNNLSLQIIGDTFVYDNIKSSYKIKLVNEEDSIKLYKLLKALFIMQTEIKNRFEVTTKIDSKNNLELYLEKTKVTYEGLADIIKNEIESAKEEIKTQNKDKKDLNKKLEKLKEKVILKEEEYQNKQKEISTYLECRKTFFGKVKYFFKTTKTDKKCLEDKKEKDEKQSEIDQNIEPIDILTEEKEYYTIDDMVVIYNILEKKEKICKDLNQDIKALELKLENYVSKVKNASLYIKEIDEHKKSIFEFWKFANKDENLGLEAGQKEDKEDKTKVLRKAFDFEMDFEDLGVKVDGAQKRKLSREETDSIFIAKTNLLYILNMIRCNELDKFALETALENLKEEFNKNRLYIDSETFDIFGNIEDDNRRLKYLGSRTHRENEKSKFKILNINKKIDVFDFTEKLHSIVNYLEGSIPKMTSVYDTSLYKIVPITEKLKENCLDVFNISVENELKEYVDNGEGALNLIKVNFKEGMPVIYYSNIIFYDNNNQTLPDGMDMSSNVLIDCNKFDFKLLSKTKFRTNNYFAESNNLILPKSKDIFVYEYDIFYKEVENV